MKKTIIFLFILSLSFILSCSNSDNKKKNKVIVPEKTPLIMINEQSFYIDDLLKYAHFILTELSDESLENKEIKKKILNDFISHNLLTQKARSEGISIDKEKIHKVIKNFNSIYGEKDLNTFTSQSILDLEHLKAIIEQQMMIQKYLDSKVSSQISIRKEELKEYYKIKIINFPKTKTIQLLHIVTNSKVEADKARKLLYKRKSFATVAKKYSIGPAKEKGGDLGYVDVQDFPEVFQNALKLRKGRISKVIKSAYGYHIFKVVDIKVNEIPTFEELSGELYADLFAQKQDNMTNKLIQELLQNANIQIFSDFSLNLSAIDSESGDNK